jgi:hypothetical protein
MVMTKRMNKHYYTLNYGKKTKKKSRILTIVYSNSIELNFVKSCKANISSL